MSGSTPPAAGAAKPVTPQVPVDPTVPTSSVSPGGTGTVLPPADAPVGTTNPGVNPNGPGTPPPGAQPLDAPHLNNPSLANPTSPQAAAANVQAAQGVELPEGTPAPNKQFRNFANPRATNQRKERIEKLLMEEVIGPMDLQPDSDQGSANELVMIVRTKKGVRRVRITDGTQDKPVVSMVIEGAAKEGGSPEQLSADRESFEFTNAAGFVRAVKTMLERQDHVLGIKEMLADKPKPNVPTGTGK